MLKQFVIVTIVILLLTACRPTDNERARDLILHYCDIHFKHYQPRNFELLHEYYIPYQNSTQYNAYIKQKQQLKQQKDSLHLLITKQNKPVYLLQSDSVNKALDSIDRVINQYTQNYKPVRHGWIMVHAYNQKTGRGPVIRKNTIFIINDDITKVLETYDK